MCAGIKGLIEQSEEKGRKEGREKGREEGREEGRIAESIDIYRDEMNLDNDSIIAKITDKFNLSPQDAEKYVLAEKTEFPIPSCQ